MKAAWESEHGATKSQHYGKGQTQNAIEDKNNQLCNQKVQGSTCTETISITVGEHTHALLGSERTQEELTCIGAREMQAGYKEGFQGREPPDTQMQANVITGCIYEAGSTHHKH